MYGMNLRASFQLSIGILFLCEFRVSFSIYNLALHFNIVFGIKCLIVGNKE